MIKLLLATATFVYTLESGKTYQACYQAEGENEPTCEAFTQSPHSVEIADDTLFDLFVTVDGVESERVTYRTAKKKPAAPILSVAN